MMHVHDVIIVGAGPAGLAAAARLHEHTPSATFTDDEHQRYHWIKKHGRKMNIKNYKTNTNSLPTPPLTPEGSYCGCDNHSPSTSRSLDLLVLDADGNEWMTKWNRLFKIFAIEHLRSPMFFQVDPADRDALLAYAYEKGREKELVALPGCAGKEVSKHKKKKRLNTKGRFLQRTPDVDERDRKDYFVPSTPLFAAHCEDVIRRYHLGQHILRQERVIDIVYDGVERLKTKGGDGFEGDESVASDDSNLDESRIFKIVTDGGMHLARVVILAVGPGNAPSIPPIYGLPQGDLHEGCTHAMQLKHFPPPHMLLKIKSRQSTHMLIVGGGLTSIQLADLALRRGVNRVWLLMRGPLKVKYFDVDLDWVGKFRNFKQAEFWTADTDDERFEMIMQARNGGSITPRYRKLLDQHVATGKISLHLHTTLHSMSWDKSSKQWTSIRSLPEVSFPHMDYIVFATGIQSDIRTLPFLRTMQRYYPISTIGGLPCLNDDLMWNDNVPLFVTGRLAGLKLGPGAPNLVGARIGAERIAWNVEDVLKKLGRLQGSSNEGGSDSESLNGESVAYVAARDNRFNSLAYIQDE